MRVLLILRFDYGTDETAFDINDREFEVFETTIDDVMNQIKLQQMSPWFDEAFIFPHTGSNMFDYLDNATYSEVQQYINENEQFRMIP